MPHTLDLVVEGLQIDKDTVALDVGRWQSHADVLARQLKQEGLASVTHEAFKAQPGAYSSS